MTNQKTETPTRRPRRLLNGQYWTECEICEVRQTLDRRWPTGMYICADCWAERPADFPSYDPLWLACERCGEEVWCRQRPDGTTTCFPCWRNRAG